MCVKLSTTSYYGYRLFYSVSLGQTRTTFTIPIVFERFVWLNEEGSSSVSLKSFTDFNF